MTIKEANEKYMERIASYNKIFNKLGWPKDENFYRISTWGSTVISSDMTVNINGYYMLGYWEPIYYKTLEDHWSWRDYKKYAQMGAVKYYLEPQNTTSEDDRNHWMLAQGFSYWGEIDDIYPSLDASEPSTVAVYINDDYAGIGWMTYDIQYYSSTDPVESVYSRINATDMDIKKTALINKDTVGKNNSLLAGLDNADGEYTYTVETKEYKTNSIEIECTTEKAGVLVLAEVYVDGWKAYIDGEPTEIMEANYCRKALYVDEGHHTIRLIYQPDSYRLGVGMAVVVCAFIAGFGLFSLYKRVTVKKRHKRTTKN